MKFKLFQKSLIKETFHVSLFCLLICLTQIKLLYGLDINSKEYQLHDKLFENYTRSIRPTQNWKDQLNMNLNVYIQKIASVVENHQTVIVFVRLEMIWVDNFLKWDPNSYENIDSIVLPSEQVWIPDMHLFNSAAEDDLIHPSSVRLFSNGTIQAYPINQLYAHCDYDFDRFPFDTQQCDFIIGSIIDKNKLNILLNVTYEGTKTDSNLEWIFLSVKEKPLQTLMVPGTNDKSDLFYSDWSVTRFTLSFRRTSTFYVHLFVYPLIFILFITMSLFILPPSCIERATLGVLLLLSLVIISLMLDSYTPKNSSTVSIIGKLIGFTMFMITWSTVLSTLIIGIHKDFFIYRRVPIWLKNIMIKYLGKITLKYETVYSSLGPNQNNMEDEIEIMDINNLYGQNNSGATITNRSGTIKLIKNELNSPSEQEASTSTGTSVADKNNSDISQAKAILALINNQLSLMRMKIKEKDYLNQNKKEWYLIAITLDRFCLILYFLIMLVGLFIIFI